MISVALKKVRLYIIEVLNLELKTTSACYSNFYVGVGFVYLPVKKSH